MVLARTNLTIPEDLLREVDELAGPRGRSAFVAEAVAARVRRERLARAIGTPSGSAELAERPLDRTTVARLVSDLREGSGIGAASVAGADGGAHGAGKAKGDRKRRKKN